MPGLITYWAAQSIFYILHGNLVLPYVRICSTVLTQPGTLVSFQGMFIYLLFDFWKLRTATFSDISLLFMYVTFHLWLLSFPLFHAICHRAIFHTHFPPVISTLTPTHSFTPFTFHLLSLFSTLLSCYWSAIWPTTFMNFYDLKTIPFIIFFIHTLSFKEMRTW